MKTEKNPGEAYNHLVITAHFYWLARFFISEFNINQSKFDREKVWNIFWNGADNWKEHTNHQIVIICRNP